jgi:hypothetical protein
LFHGFRLRLSALGCFDEYNLVAMFEYMGRPARFGNNVLIDRYSDAFNSGLKYIVKQMFEGTPLVKIVWLVVYSYFHIALNWKNYRDCPAMGDEKTATVLLLLFPSAVLTASGSKGISQRKAPLKFFVNVNIKKVKKQIQGNKNLVMFQLPCGKRYELACD